MAFVVGVSGLVNQLSIAAEEANPELDFQGEESALRDLPEDLESAEHGNVHEYDASNDMPEDAVANQPEDMSDFQTVFPPDTRERITPTTHFPASTITHVEFEQFGSTLSNCTGTFISPNAVLTAAHCIYHPEHGWATDMRVIPARDGDIEPFGHTYANFGWVPAAWEHNLDLEWDWGILSLPDPTLGNNVGWLTMGILPTESLLAPDFNPGMAGYPGDKVPGGTMWLATEPGFVAANHAFLAHRIDTYGGQSGSAVWRGRDGLIVGIHVLGFPDINLASRVNEELVSWLLYACSQMGCHFDVEIADPSAPQPTPEPPPADPDPPPPPPEPTPTPEPTPEPPPADPSPPTSESPVFATGHDVNRAVDNFATTRHRTDLPIDDGQVNRTWMWGPEANSAAIEEEYAESPGGSRVVQYFDKSRMEDNEHAAGPPWHVTNGLLVVELITGRMQIGDNEFVDRHPADVQVAGDDHPESPTYAMLDPLRDWDALSVGAQVTQRLNSDGSVTDDGSLGQHGVTASHYVPETDHTVASVFWEFMNSSGTIYDQGQHRQGDLFENPFFATGLPIIEPYWVNVPVGGEWQDVLLQCFERRCLTYTPGNSPGWQVEAGNVGQHYYRWRYGDAPAWP